MTTDGDQSRAQCIGRVVLTGPDDHIPGIGPTAIWSLATGRLDSGQSQGDRGFTNARRAGQNMQLASPPDTQTNAGIFSASSGATQLLISDFTGIPLMVNPSITFTHTWS